ncbi:YqzE family protein [Virgibacillus phasianinus]|uniref:YqzE family protein n=1 Tax=Virgibacillus phasianinus TaxID=2017483 RepID=A0A220U546_9BACI|nr:YqzE family protein [Virgibacillus phasianinus]ASK63210.1 YqzE family protein [Virgibacillus phasianinus]
MSGNDYIKYITGQIIAYLDLSTDEKKARRKEHKTSKHSFSNRWLGMVPFAMKMLWKKAN